MSLILLQLQLGLVVLVVQQLLRLVVHLYFQHLLQLAVAVQIPYLLAVLMLHFQVELVAVSHLLTLAVVVLVLVGMVQSVMVALV